MTFSDRIKELREKRGYLRLSWPTVLYDDFFALTGMWENRDIDADKLRAKAWSKTK